LTRHDSTPPPASSEPLGGVAPARRAETCPAHRETGKLRRVTQRAHLGLVWARRGGLFPRLVGHIIRVGRPLPLPRGHVRHPADSHVQKRPLLDVPPPRRPRPRTRILDTPSFVYYFTNKTLTDLSRLTASHLLLQRAPSCAPPTPFVCIARSATDFKSQLGRGGTNIGCRPRRVSQPPPYGFALSPCVRW